MEEEEGRGPSHFPGLALLPAPHLTNVPLGGALFLSATTVREVVVRDFKGPAP